MCYGVFRYACQSTPLNCTTILPDNVIIVKTQKDPHSYRAKRHIDVSLLV